jgi:hypothetical protein
VSDYELVDIGGEFALGINKVGGGTVGREYAQEHWEVSIHRLGGEWEAPELMYVGRPVTHMDAAKIARESIALREAL